MRQNDTFSWLKQLFFTRCNIDTLDTWIDTGWRERFSQVCEDDCYLHGSRGPRNKNQVVVLYDLNELSGDFSKLESQNPDQERQMPRLALFPEGCEEVVNVHQRQVLGLRFIVHGFMVRSFIIHSFTLLCFIVHSLIVHGQ